MLRELQTASEIEAMIPQSLIKENRLFIGGIDGVYEMYDGDNPLPDVDEVLNVFSETVINDLFPKTESGKPNVPKQIVIPMNGGFIPYLHTVYTARTLQAEGDPRFKGIDLEAWFNQNTLISIHSKTDVKLLSLSGDPRELEPESTTVIVDDIGDSLKTMKDIMLLSTDPTKVHMYTPTIKIPTLTQHMAEVSSEIAERFGIQGEFSMKSNLHTALIFPSKEVDGQESTIWIAAGGGLNRGCDNDSEEMNALHRLSNKFYYSRMAGTVSLVDQGDEIRFLRSNLINLALDFPFLAEGENGGGIQQLENMKNQKAYEGVAMTAKILIAKLFSHLSS